MSKKQTKLIQSTDGPIMLKTWTTIQAVPEYKVMHQFHTGFTCNTLKIPQIRWFGHKHAQFELATEYIKGAPLANLELYVKAYKKIVAKMPKPLRQSQKNERKFWDFVRKQIHQPSESESTDQIKKIRTLLSHNRPNIKMNWAHSKFIPEHLIKVDDSVYLVNFNGFTYLPEFWIIAQQINLNPEFKSLYKYFTADEVEKILYCQLAQLLIADYSNDVKFPVELADQLLTKINA